MMGRIRLTRRFVFDMAHALLSYDGPCKNIHGHTYSFSLTLLGDPLQAPGHPKDGMVYDFSLLKGIVERKVLQQFDHALVLSANENEDLVRNIADRYEKVVLLKLQPTCEHLLLHFIELVKNELPENLKLDAARLDETPNSYAEWRIEDQ